MTIELVWGTGEGTTQLSAFDASLADAGIHNYNLVTLSSVIPEGIDVESSGTHERRWEVGELVGVVLAENESTVTGETIAAGLGWATAEEGGIFYEATAESVENVESLLERGLDRAKTVRDSWNWKDEIETQVVEHTVENNGAAIVSAIYRPV